MVEETQLPPALGRGGAVLGRWLGGWALSARPALRTWPGAQRMPGALAQTARGPQCIALWADGSGCWVAPGCLAEQSVWFIVPDFIWQVDVQN